MKFGSNEMSRHWADCWTDLKIFKLVQSCAHDVYQKKSALFLMHTAYLSWAVADYLSYKMVSCQMNHG